ASIIANSVCAENSLRERQSTIHEENEEINIGENINNETTNLNLTQNAVNQIDKNNNDNTANEIIENQHRIISIKTVQYNINPIQPSANSLKEQIDLNDPQNSVTINGNTLYYKHPYTTKETCLSQTKTTPDKITDHLNIAYQGQLMYHNRSCPNNAACGFSCGLVCFLIIVPITDVTIEMKVNEVDLSYYAFYDKMGCSMKESCKATITYIECP
uniref:Uncharacterized protein n=1 Tax=Meloidogyne javanica TaxID=6303 RepID=A0A915M0N6_MELJA